MRFPRPDVFLIVLIVCISLPGAIAYIAYIVTGDPTLIPLGVTQQELAKTKGTIVAHDIAVQIDWGADADYASTPQEIEFLLNRSLNGFGVDHHFRHATVPGGTVAVTYFVSGNQFGPYTPGNAVRGIRAAVAALKIGRPKTDP